MFDPSVLFEAFRDEGMVHAATRLGTVPAAQFYVGFLQPSVLILSDAVQTDDIEVEYVTTQALDLAVGERLSICGKDYRVRQPPDKQADGYFSRAKLEELAA